MNFSPARTLRRPDAVFQTLRPLYPWLDDPAITEIAINRPGEVWTKEADGWQRNECLDLTNYAIDALVSALISYNGLDKAPISEVELPSGERGEIMLPPSVIQGTVSLVIRKHSPTVKTLEQLDTEGAFDKAVDVSFNQPSEEEAVAYTHRQDFMRLSYDEVFMLDLKHGHRWRRFLGEAVLHCKNIVIAGSTGSGKTTLCRSLIGKVPANERLVTIEDVHELHLPDHPNRVHMLHGQGTGRVSVEECLKACFRISPDRIFLSEMRGPEAWEYLQSLNCGHPGSITTVHANSAIAAFSRIAGLVKQSAVGRMLDIEDIRRTLFETIDVVVFMEDWKVTEVFYDPIFARSKVNETN